MGPTRRKATPPMSDQPTHDPQIDEEMVPLDEYGSGLLCTEDDIRENSYNQ